LVADLMIDPDHDLVIIEAAGIVEEEIESGYGRVGRWNPWSLADAITQEGQQRFGDAVFRDAVAGKRRSAQRIDQRFSGRNQARKIAAELCRRRIVPLLRDVLYFPEKLARDEEERAVLSVVNFRNSNRASERAAELVAFERRRAVRLREEIVGIQFVVAQELVNAAMQPVRARACYQVYLGAGFSAKRGRVVARRRLKFLHRIDAGREGVAPVLVLLDGGAVEQVEIVVALLAVNVEAGCCRIDLYSIEGVAVFRARHTG